MPMLTTWLEIDIDNYFYFFFARTQEIASLKGKEKKIYI